MSIPSSDQVRERLLPLNQAAIKALAGRSKVPFHTLLKIRRGEVKNPRIETVRKLWPALEAVVVAGDAL